MAVIRVTAFDHLVLRVADLDRSLAFYHDLLGIGVEWLDAYRAGTRPFVSLRVGESLIDLVPDPTFDATLSSSHGGLLHFCLRMDGGGLSEVVAALRERGVDVIEDQPMHRMGASGAGLSIYVRDPDGYVVEIKEGDTDPGVQGAR